MSSYLPIALLSALAALVLTPVASKLARLTGYLDRPSTRKIHASPMPLLGGLAIYAALVIGLLVSGLGHSQREALAIVLAVTLVALVGMWDDRFGMSPGIKFGGQVLAAVILVAGGIQIRLFSWPVVDLALTLFWVVGICNAINLMDNMDGLAAGVSAVSAGFFLLVASTEGQVLVSALAAAICGAAIGFLFWNFYPATTFMGDVGSLVLGLTLAVLGMKLNFRAVPQTVTWMIPVLILGLPIFDTTLVVISRIRRRVPVYLGGADHTSHRLVRLGLSHSRAVMTLYLAGALLGMAAVGVTRLPGLWANVAFVGLIVVGGIAILLLDRVTLGAPLESPKIVVIPGGGGACQAISAARSLGQRVTVVVSDGTSRADLSGFSLSEILACFGALAADPIAVTAVLQDHALSREQLPNWIESANVALNLQGEIKSTGSVVMGGGKVPNGEALKADPLVLEAIRDSTMLVVGPGDLTQNAIPSLLAPGIVDSVRASAGARVLIATTPAGFEQADTWLPRDLFTHRLVVAEGASPLDLGRQLHRAQAMHPNTPRPSNAQSVELAAQPDS